MISGNIESIKKSLLKRLDIVFEKNTVKSELINNDILNAIIDVTREINREISVIINRKGEVKDVFIGDSSMVEIPIIEINERKLSGLRIIHTHPNGNPFLSTIDLSALVKMKLDCIAAVGVKDNTEEICIGFCDIKNEILTYETIGPIKINEIYFYDILDKVLYIESLMKEKKLYEIESVKETAILVGVENWDSINELEELAKACDVIVVNSILQNNTNINAAYLIGKGKVEELSLLSQAMKANLIIFDEELTASQIRNLEEKIGIKVIDRNTLILEIFARRAKSKESKIQVELAQLKYRYSRLAGLGHVLSRTGGGIGTRGPGEKKLEIDKRHIKERIYELQREMIKMKKIRQVQREKRHRENISRVSLVGYTNAGKSTLRNNLCSIALPNEYPDKKQVFTADMLFATLDTTTRAIILPDNRLITLTDTVGFVRKLPHELIEAFKSTLEEVIDSDLLIHVVDVSNEECIKQIEVVNDVLSELGAFEKPRLLVLNKIDKASQGQIERVIKLNNKEDKITISAKNSINIDNLLDMISSKLPYKLKKVQYLIPYDKQNLVAYLHRNSKIIEEKYEQDGTIILCYVNEEVYNKCKIYMIL